MEKPMPDALTASVVATLLGGLMLLASSGASAASMVEEGKQIAEDRRKGNCLACHAMGDGQLPGNIGPPLVAMKARFPDKAALRAQIADATNKNPNTMMPPFGRHNVLSDEEIDKITAYVHTL